MLRVPYPQLGHVRLGAHIVTDIYPPLYHTQTTLAGATPAQPLQYTRANNPSRTTHALVLAGYNLFHAHILMNNHQAASMLQQM